MCEYFVGTGRVSDDESGFYVVLEGGCHEFLSFIPDGPDDHEGSLGGIAEGAEDIEDGGKFEGLPHGRDMFHGGGELWGEHEAEFVFRDGGGGVFWREVCDSEGFEDVCGS